MATATANEISRGTESSSGVLTAIAAVAIVRQVVPSFEHCTFAVPIWSATHRSESQALGRDVVGKLKDVIPRQNFQVALQAAIGGKFIARADISAYRKDVTTGLYGGDVSRKKKVLAKQAKGKKRMKRFGKVDIPSEAFTVMLKRD